MSDAIGNPENWYSCFTARTCKSWNKTTKFFRILIDRTQICAACNHKLYKTIVPPCEKTNNLGFGPGENINWHVQSQKQARTLKFWM